MKIGYECENCGAIYPQEYVTTWGRTKESNGVGPSPRCCQLIEDPATPPAKDSSGEIVAPHGFAMCSGLLQRQDIEGMQLSVPANLTPIQPGRSA